MKSPHLCPTPYCRRPRRKKGTLCSRCAMREWREENPYHALLAHLRWRAKKKGLDFDLHIEWFTEFLNGSKYNRTEHHIDRISVAKGYVMGNLQVLPITENIAKGNRERGKQLQIL